MSAKYRSAIYAILIYLSLLALLFGYFNHHNSKPKTIHYVKKNDDRIEVGLSSAPTKKSLPTAKPKKKQTKKSRPKPKKSHKPKPKKVKPKKQKKPKKKVIKKPKPKPKAKPKPDIKRLFKDIKDTKPSHKSQKSSEVKNSKTKHITSSMKNVETKDRGVINRYFAKVEETLYYWPALSGFEGERAEVWLKIERDGSFIFRLTKRSNNQDFNSGLIQYLKQLQRVGFARHTYGRSLEARVEFEAKE
jgi:outer membrane biosynthesis protein TonB